MLRASRDFNSVLAIIEEKKVKCLFISPHFDDVVLSAGSVLGKLAEKKLAYVVNVFTQVSPAPLTQSAKQALKNAGYSDGRKYYQDREKQDGQVLKTLGIKPENLGEVEALWRKKTWTGRNRWLYQIIPEAGHVYPFYRWQVISGRISLADNDLGARLAEKLRRVIKQTGCGLVWAPWGIGKHVDHLVVRKAAESLGKDVILWSDFPYDTRGRVETTPALPKGQWWQAKADTRMKRKLICGYTNQVELLFPGRSIKLPPERFFVPAALGEKFERNGAGF